MLLKQQKINPTYIYIFPKHLVFLFVPRRYNKNVSSALDVNDDNAVKKGGIFSSTRILLAVF